MLSLKQKKKAVESIRAKALGSTGLAILDFSGHTVQEIEEARSIARSLGVATGVFKNALIKRGFEQTPYASWSDQIKGPSMLFLSTDGPGDAARVLVQFKRQGHKPNVKLLAIGSDVFEGKELEAISRLPNKQEALAQLACVLQAPQVKLASTLQQIYAGLARVLLAVSDSK